MELSKVKLIVLNFDGVLTNNKVLLIDQAEEFVICFRADGLSCLWCIKNIKIKNYSFVYRKSKVFSNWAKKLQVECVQGIENNKDKLIELIKNLS